MYKDKIVWTLKHKNTASANIVDPQTKLESYKVSADNLLYDIAWNTVSAPVQALTLYTVKPTPNFPDSGLLRVAFFGADNSYISEFDPGGYSSVFTTPAGCSYCRLTYDASVEFYGGDFQVVPSGSAFSDYYTSREVYPIYDGLKRSTKKEPNQFFYRNIWEVNLKLLKDDYDYVAAIPFTDKIIIGHVDLKSGLTSDMYFYKTDCSFDSDNKILTVKPTTKDLYDAFLGSLDKTFNLVELAAKIEPVILNRRSITQVYIAGDNALTNIVSGSYWEQKLQIDPVFSHSTLIDTYKFFNVDSIRNIPISYAPSLSTDVTGEYDLNLENVNGLYKVFVDPITVGGYTQFRFYIVDRVTGGTVGGWKHIDDALYITGYTDLYNTSISAVIFNGINGETGSFYFTEYRIYVRLLTSLLEVNGLATYQIPATDIIAQNSNYKRVIGYNLNQFTTYDAFQVQPNAYGLVPEGTPDSGKYYKKLSLSPATGIKNTIPVASSNWRAVSLWYLETNATRFAEFAQSETIELRDCYPLGGVLQAILKELDIQVAFSDTVASSEFLYSAQNPFGAFQYLDFTSGTTTLNQGNLKLLLTAKSNAIIGNYDQTASKAAISLGELLNMLSICFNCGYHLDGNTLRIEHAKWYMNGGSYAGENIGLDATILKQPINGKAWSFGQNSWTYDKQNMPERLEYNWMDPVSPAFEGDAITILDSFTQKGNIVDKTTNRFTTDLDYLAANPESVSKQGFCIFGAVFDNGKNRVPIVEVDQIDGEPVLQNGHLCFAYLQQKFMLYNLPAKNVKIGATKYVLTAGLTRNKKQVVDFPWSIDLNSYALVKTELGNGAISDLELNANNLFIKATIMHNNE